MTKLVKTLPYIVADVELNLIDDKGKYFIIIIIIVEVVVVVVEVVVVVVVI